LKQTLKKINWLTVAQMLVVLVMAFAPLVTPELADAQTNPLNRKFRCDTSLGLNCDTQSLNELIFRIIRILLGVAFAIAVLFLIIGGFYYITAQGNEEAAGKGKQTVINALIGIAIIIMSYVMVNVIANLVYNQNDSGI
jgi:hypothetical protein